MAVILNKRKRVQGGCEWTQSIPAPVGRVSPPGPVQRPRRNGASEIPGSPHDVSSLNISYHNALQLHSSKI
ncbi:hypothetical protein CDAR_409401 [Caerostris darwini]|uniref:Uncharacterized protein n=1 Tax=Caerostris darwini TaxID=1538125 RepID=A0AAV4S597_9ARAC|nr:hypothetical protein CDAR_409401 [Caerostris darwini]